MRPSLRMKSLRRFVSLVLVALAAGAGLLWWNSIEPGAIRAEEITTGAQTATVDYVIDGDTVDLVIDGQQERVRLIGVDTPESVSRDTPVQCYGEEASTALKGLLPIDSAVLIERDQEVRDRFGRLLLYVYRAEDSLFVNEWLVANGFADTLFFEPNTTYRSAFTELRNTARSQEVGLWGACDGPDQPLS